MDNKQQTLQKIKELESQLDVLKKELEKKYPTPEQAKVGDVLEDGSIVFIKGDGYVIVSASPEFDVITEYNDCMEEYFCSDAWVKSQLQSEREDCCWFLPDKELLRRAMLVIPEQFKNDYYWSSSKSFGENTRYCYFINGVVREYSAEETEKYYMRAFKVIAY